MTQALVSFDEAKGYIWANMDRMEAACGQAINKTKMLSIFLNVLANNAKLLQCDRVSLLGAMVQANHIGLSLEPVLGQAALVPFKGKVQLIPMYRGLIALAKRSGDVATVEAHEVYELDGFDYEYGLDGFLKHSPGARPRGEMTHAYCIVTLQTGQKQFHVMDKEEIEAIEKKAPGSSSPDSAWKKYKSEQWRKTPCRNLLKYMDLSEQIQAAVGLDMTQEAGIEQNNENWMNMGTLEEKTAGKTEDLKAGMRDAKPGENAEITDFDKKTEKEMIKHLQAKRGGMGVEPDAFKKYYCMKYEVGSINDMTKENLINLYGYMVNQPDEFKRDCEFEPDPEEA